MNFAGTPNWQPGVLEAKTGPVSYTVKLADGRVWRRRCDHLGKRLPMETAPTAATRAAATSAITKPHSTNRGKATRGDKNS